MLRRTRPIAAGRRSLLPRKFAVDRVSPRERRARLVRSEFPIPRWVGRDTEAHCYCRALRLPNCFELCCCEGLESCIPRFVPPPQNGRVGNCLIEVSHAAQFRRLYERRNGFRQCLQRAIHSTADRRVLTFRRAANLLPCLVETPAPLTKAGETSCKNGVSAADTKFLSIQRASIESLFSFL